MITVLELYWLWSAGVVVFHGAMWFVECNLKEGTKWKYPLFESSIAHLLVLCVYMYYYIIKHEFF